MRKTRWTQKWLCLFNTHGLGFCLCCFCLLPAVLEWFSNVVCSRLCQWPSNHFASWACLLPPQWSERHCQWGIPPASHTPTSCGPISAASLQGWKCLFSWSLHLSAGSTCYGNIAMCSLLWLSFPLHLWWLFLVHISWGFSPTLISSSHNLLPI